jgi:hypothetical protein
MKFWQTSLKLDKMVRSAREFDISAKHLEIFGIYRYGTNNS